LKRRAFLQWLGVAGLLPVAAARATAAAAVAASAQGEPGSDEFRRVVTGVDADGHSVVVSNGVPPTQLHPRHPQQVLTDLWITDAVPADHSAPVDREFQFQPSPGGVHIIRNKLPPDAVMYSDEAGRPRVPGKHEYLHRTKTIDFIQVLDGELWLILEDGSEVQLVAGDCVVQNGTLHAWRNRSDAPVTFLAVMVDANPATLPATPLGAEPVHG